MFHLLQHFVMFSCNHCPLSGTLLAPLFSWAGSAQLSWSLEASWCVWPAVEWLRTNTNGTFHQWRKQLIFDLFWPLREPLGKAATGLQLTVTRKNVKHAHINFTKSKVMSSNCVFCPTNSPKPSNSLYMDHQNSLQFF